MTPDKYTRVKEIFLAACDKPLAERTNYVIHATAGDPEILREVQSLLKEHSRDTQVMPENPESPAGSMSAILSRANLDLANENSLAVAAAEDAARSNDPHRRPGDDLLDESNPSSGSNSGFVDAGRFMAGTVATGRYRIIELLGRGGMGEVYRADDITLNQSVALKFLPALFGQDQTWLERFYNEVRLARQVTHPNVCRVFDIGQFQGEHFISMEYVDGENLASLLRRIGRLPNDKGLQIARQLCAGLAAAHDRGVLHRDLKPANVMIDGRGSVRITDFGLAAPADQFRKEAGSGTRAGTPAYMSPEQLAGKSATIRSDVYSLGLVLYEMFTGKRAFRGGSFHDYQKLHSSEHPTPPSDIVHDIDPIVERVILRCLEKDPKDRPTSALAVSAGLPGGDPLREILAAGETPSPEVVAAAGEAHRGLTPRIATLFLVAGILCLVLVGMLAPRAFVVQRAIRENPPVVLSHEAREILKTFGYTDTPVDSASGFAVNSAYYSHIQTGPRTPDRMELLSRPHLGLVSFWYRQSPEPLVPWHADLAVAADDPPATVPGMVGVSLDPTGRLIGLEAQTVGPDPAPFVSGASDKASSVDWPPLLKAAEMDTGHFRETPSTQVPPVYTDQRAAWSGYFDDAREEKLHVEAGAFHGKIVYFSIATGWKDDSSEGLSVIIQTLVNIFLVIAGGILAYHNYRSGRSDRSGATRIALAFFVLGTIAWLFRTHHVPNAVLEFHLFTHAMGPVMYTVALVWVFYLALEPYVRRVWPETVISWTRLLAGHWIDPLVGRDVLIGATAGIGITLLNALERLVPSWLGMPAPMPNINNSMHILESATNFSTLFSGAVSSIYIGLLLLLFLVVMRIVLKRKSLTAFAFVSIFLAASPQLSTHDYISWLVAAISAIVFLTLMVRNGLVAMIFCALTRMLLTDFPISFDFTAWYKASAACGIAATLLILVVATYAALGGKPLITLRLSES
jgi:Protein kinase domain